MRVLRTWSAWSNHGACPPEVWSSASGMTGAARRASPTAPKGSFSPTPTGSDGRLSQAALSYSPARRRLTVLRLRTPLIASRHLGQYRCIGDVRSTTWWQLAHSRSATLSHSRDRIGRGSEISLVVSPRERSKWPAPARPREPTTKRLTGKTTDPGATLTQHPDPDRGSSRQRRERLATLLRPLRGLSRVRTRRHAR